MDITTVQHEIDILIEQGTSILQTKHTIPGRIIMSSPLSGQTARAPSTEHVDWEEQKRWATQIISILNSIIELPQEYLSEFEKYKDNTSPSSVSLRIKLLGDIKNQIQRSHIEIKQDNSSIDSLSSLKNILLRFHKIARQLRTRYNSRVTIEINDEYDVQNLLHALLHIYFNDIRAEEWTPSYAGSSARQDFLLKNEKIVIEVKKTRKSMTDRDLGEQLIVDIDKYKSHNDCHHLVCFVYDPEGFLGNPKGIMNDLNKQHKGFAEVIIVPE